MHTAAPLGDKMVRASWAPTVDRTQEARLALQRVDENVYSGRLTDAPADTPILVSLIDLALCDWDPEAYPPVATRGVTVNGTELTHLTQGAPLSTGFLFTMKSNGTVVQ